MNCTIQTLREYKELEEKLSRLDAAVLAQELTKLAVHSQAAANVAYRLTSTPDENIARFNLRLRNMNSAHYANSDYMEDLQALLSEIQSGATSPGEEMEGLLQICQTDDICFKLGEDECTELVSFYTEDLATALENCAQRLIECHQFPAQIKHLMVNDQYGIRGPVLGKTLIKLVSE